MTYIGDTKIKVANVYKSDLLNPITVEDAYALSMKINNSDLFSWGKSPRTISILPVAKGCQAKCPFCFSHSSISEKVKQTRESTQLIENFLVKAKIEGAERAVITGGGEPTMLPFDRLCNLVNICATYYDKVVMITNGYSIGRLNNEKRFAMLKTLEKNGLNVLSVSRHGTDDENNEKIMYLNTKSENISKTLYNYDSSFDNLKLRWVCVLQKGGVYDENTLEKYLKWVVDTGVTEICFKELYVATSYESVYYDNKTNVWSRENQIPLSLVTSYMEKKDGKVINRLPWGSPIYSIIIDGIELSIAAYTEPSVYWERINGVCRSWNVMSDGTCYASLEDKNSVIYL
mgnify:CR=1 FL=1